MHINDVAERAGVTVKAVRYYESRGLISPQRAANGYRTYEDADVRVVREVRALLSLGLTAEQTRPFVECLRAGNDRADVCPASLSAYRDRIADIDARISELAGLRGQLADLLAQAESYRTTPGQAGPTPKENR
jgi:DNA-binding transcriptional MerR regulator